MCSISHGTNACLMGMDFSIFASRANLSVLKNPRTSMTPTSVAPFDYPSYAALCSVVRDYSPPTLNFISSRVCVTNAGTNTPWSVLRMSLT